jgi:hypothetical protein
MLDISEDDIRRYEENGVICLRGVFDRYWIDLLAAGIAGIAASTKSPAIYFHRCGLDKFTSIFALSYQ